MATQPPPKPGQSDLATGLQVFQEMKGAKIWLSGVLVAAAVGGIITYVFPNVWISRPWNLFLSILLLLIALFSTWLIAMIVISFREIAETNQQITDSKAKLLHEAADTIQPAWDLALATLTQYWQRNTAQNRSIFIVSVFAIAAGFGVMLLGSWAALNPLTTRSSVEAAAVVSVGGILTQFIGATFLIMYRSTLQQMTTFNATLSAINSVGMAWYLLQAIDDSTPTEKLLKNKTLAQLALSIVGSHSDKEPEESPQANATTT